MGFDVVGAVAQESYVEARGELQLRLACAAVEDREPTPEIPSLVCFVQSAPLCSYGDVRDEYRGGASLQSRRGHRTSGKPSPVIGTTEHMSWGHWRARNTAT